MKRCVLLKELLLLFPKVRRARTGEDKKMCELSHADDASYFVEHTYIRYFTEIGINMMADLKIKKWRESRTESSPTAIFRLYTRHGDYRSVI